MKISNQSENCDKRRGKSVVSLEPITLQILNGQKNVRCTVEIHLASLLPTASHGS